MATRLDASPQARLRHLASQRGCDEFAFQEALDIFKKHGNVAAAEAFLLSSSRRSVPTVALTTEQRIERCARQMSAAPDVLDIIASSLKKVLEQPTAERFRKINVSAGPFKERVSSRSMAAVEMLYAVGYEPMHGFLVLQKHDPHLLKHALAALDTIQRHSPEYIEGKEVQANERAHALSLVEDSKTAAARRAAYLAKVPAEPTADEDGRASSACVITVKLAGVDPYKARIGTRRFDSDNTLLDLFNYVRSLEQTPNAERITIENVTTRPARLLDPNTDGSKSLYALDLWPRAQVQVRVSA